VEGRKEGNISHLVNEKRDLDNRQSCIQAHVRAIFTWDGKCIPCCPAIDETLVIGNIHKQSLSEIFNGIQAERLRRKLKDKTAFRDIKACKNCPSFESYRGFKPVWNS
jgi:radical SAM protein with 4Fe4S-binding SPASM domain